MNKMVRILESREVVSVSLRNWREDPYRNQTGDLNNLASSGRADPITDHEMRRTSDEGLIGVDTIAAARLTGAYEPITQYHGGQQ